MIEPDGESTARRVVLVLALVDPDKPAATFLGMTGSLYAAAAIAAGLGLLYFGAPTGTRQNRGRAHALLLASVLYLPALLAAMVLDRRAF